MPDIIKVGINEPRPTHDISLTDNRGNQVGLILTNRLGVRDPKGILEGNMPRTALRTSQGNAGYDDLELPFTAEVQSTMVGGRAQEDFSRDRTKYSDAYRLDTTKEFPVCGPAETAQIGLIDDSNITATISNTVSVELLPEYTGVCLFQIPETATIYGVTITVACHSEFGGVLYYSISKQAYGDKVAEPSTLDPDDYSSSITLSDTGLSTTSDIFLSTSSTEGLMFSAGDYICLTLLYEANPTPEGYYQPDDLGLSLYVGSDATASIHTTCVDADDIGIYGTSLYGSTHSRYFNWIDYFDKTVFKIIHVGVENNTKLFEYKRQLYVVLNSISKEQSALYMNGWRGVCTTSTNLKTLVDTTQSGTGWADNALKDCIVLIINGKGENEIQPWRKIIGSANGVLTVSPDWEVPHDKTTEYVILGSNRWTKITTSVITKSVTDIATVNDMALFAMGADAKIAYMREYNNAGTWTREFKSDPTYYADRLEPIVDEQGDLYLWRAIADGAKVDKSKVGKYTQYKILDFDLNKKLRDELELSIARAESDIAKELAKDDNLIPDEIYLMRQFNDLTTEHNRILTEYATETDDDRKEELADRDEDIWTIKWRLAGCNVTTWSDSYMTTPTSIKYGNNASIAHDKWFDPGTNTAAAGSDIALAVANTDDTVDEGYLTTLERLVEDARWQVGDKTNHEPIINHEDVYLKKYVTCGSTDSRITNLVPYGTPTIPYIIKEDSIGSILDGIYDEVPIPELKAVRSEENGIAAMAYGVYLYFNMEGTMVERYYDQRLDDVGPNRDLGLPTNRQGVIRKMVPYPGRYYIAIDAGFQGYSSILCSNELGWHEIYRADNVGERISGLHVQAIPGNSNTDLMFIGTGSDVIKIPIAINPLNQSDYQYFGYDSKNPYVETSWIDYGMKDVNKYFHSVSLFADYPLGKLQTGREFEIIIYYRLSENDSWRIAGTTINNPVFPQEIELDRLKHNVSGKRIQLKLEFKINSSTFKTPRLKAWVLNGVLRMPVKKSWQLTFALEPPEDLQDKRLSDERHSLIDQLNIWSDSKRHNTPLTMRTCDRQTDNKLVFIDPASISLINVVLEQNRGNTIKRFDHLATMTVYEV